MVKMGTSSQLTSCDGTGRTKHFAYSKFLCTPYSLNMRILSYYRFIYIVINKSETGIYKLLVQSQHCL